MKKPELLKFDPWLQAYAEKINERIEKYHSTKAQITGGKSLTDFANGHLYYGVQHTENEWILREWAPNATEIILIGDFTNWEEFPEMSFKPQSKGNWELRIPKERIKHKDLYKLKIYWKDGEGERIPAWCQRVIQDPKTLVFNAQFWFPPQPYIWKNTDYSFKSDELFIYESHIGMATEELATGSYTEFTTQVLPRIKKAGYNTLQLMAIQEHPYYGSFGYHVSSLFAPSSRFGTPDQLKALIDEAHGMGLRVIMDIVHSHAVKNINEGLGLYDGSPWQFFHKGEQRNHIAWDSLCFNYGKNEVIHFLLSNCKYWLTEFKFDGFRFDGVTSMIYLDHGLNKDFTSYDLYYDGQQDEDAIVYLGLANELCKEINPQSVTLAEEMSGYPGLSSPVDWGGTGFDYRMAMGTPDYWIKIIKEKTDEEWNLEEIFFELSQKRPEEKTVGYAESHDQALVGDKTLIFRLIDKDMYFNMSKDQNNLKVDRGIALHKMIRLLTLGTSGDSYLNFMGNEFGHPEWIDFPREGNNWSYQHARRQWSLSDNPNLKYHYLGDFDQKMIELAKEKEIFTDKNISRQYVHSSDMVLAFERANLLFLFNFHPEKSYPSYGIPCKPGKYKLCLSTDSSAFGGQDRIADMVYRTVPQKEYAPNQMVKIYLPSRTAVVLGRLKIKSVY